MVKGFAWVCLTLGGLASSVGCASHQLAKTMAGAWTMHCSSGPLLHMQLTAHGSHLKGTINIPAVLREDENGVVREIEGPVKVRTVLMKVKTNAIRGVIEQDNSSVIIKVVKMHEQKIAVDWSRGQVASWVFEKGTEHDAIQLPLDGVTDISCPVDR